MMQTPDLLNIDPLLAIDSLRKISKPIISLRQAFAAPIDPEKHCHWYCARLTSSRLMD